MIEKELYIDTQQMSIKKYYIIIQRLKISI